MLVAIILLVPIGHDNFKRMEIFESFKDNYVDFNYKNIGIYFQILYNKGDDMYIETEILKELQPHEFSTII